MPVKGLAFEKFLQRGYVSPNDGDIRGDTDSASIQQAVDAAAASGVGKIIIPRYNVRTKQCGWEIARSIRLPSDMTVILDNCTLRMADDVYENFFRTRNLFTETGAVLEPELHNITIAGIGAARLDGGKKNDLTEANSCQDGRPNIACNHPIFFFNVRYFAVENITISNQRYWGMRFEFCKCGRIANIRSDANGDRRNQDGINLRNGCHNILIENIYGQSGDDMIALSAIDTPRNDRYNAVIPAADQDIHDVIIRNISGFALDHPLVALRNHNGAKIYNIIIENVMDTPLVRESSKDYLERYALIRIGNNHYFTTRPSEMGETSDIVINNVMSRTALRGIVVAATLKNCRFSNIHAAGLCRYPISINPVWAGGIPGVKIENLTVDGVVLQAGGTQESAVLDFGTQREGDFIKNMLVRDVAAENATHLAIVSGDADITVEGLHGNGFTGEVVACRAGDEPRAKCAIR